MVKALAVNRFFDIFIEKDVLQDDLCKLSKIDRLYFGPATCDDFGRNWI